MHARGLQAPAVRARRDLSMPFDKLAEPLELTVGTSRLAGANPSEWRFDAGCRRRLVPGLWRARAADHGHQSPGGKTSRATRHDRAPSPPAPRPAPRRSTGGDRSPERCADSSLQAAARIGVSPCVDLESVAPKGLEPSIAPCNPRTDRFVLVAVALGQDRPARSDQLRRAVVISGRVSAGTQVGWSGCRSCQRRCNRWSSDAIKPRELATARSAPSRSPQTREFQNPSESETHSGRGLPC
jgi:hypothetical protein